MRSLLDRIDRINYGLSRPFFGEDCCKNCHHWHLVENHSSGVIDERIKKGWYDTFTYLHRCDNPDSLYYNEKPLGDMCCADYETNKWGRRGHNI